MIYRLDDLCESHDFEHDQKFVKAEHWKEACDEVNDLIKTKKELEQKLAEKHKEIEMLRKALENLRNDYTFSNANVFIDIEKALNNGGQG
jgi:predicted RNase H-like nuclease (RuvC/YqgF family)